MGITKTADGRYQVGKGIADANNYTGALGKRDMVIQYTEDGVTAQSMDYLNFLKDYAEHHADIGELIKPSDVSIWIAKDDKLTAVEADDISYDDGTFTLSSITYDGTDWTFGEPTPGGGGGGGVPTPTAEDVDKVLTATGVTKTITVVPEQSVTLSAYDSGAGAVLSGVTLDPSSPYDLITATVEMQGTQTTIKMVWDGTQYDAIGEGGNPPEMRMLFIYTGEEWHFVIPIQQAVGFTMLVSATAAVDADPSPQWVKPGVYFAVTVYDDDAYVATLPDTAYGSIVLALSDNDGYLAMLYVDNNGNGSVIAAGQSVTAQCVLGEITISIQST